MESKIHSWKLFEYMLEMERQKKANSTRWNCMLRFIHFKSEASKLYSRYIYIFLSHFPLHCSCWVATVASLLRHILRTNQHFTKYIAVQNVCNHFSWKILYVCEKHFFFSASNYETQLNFIHMLGTLKFCKVSK